ncbi:radical SAM protein [Treponema primitia]|uniref:radical SAM protein n=1 Tax=Treponema primitia TaxID=88058 RepID=UPI00397F973F
MLFRQKQDTFIRIYRAGKDLAGAVGYIMNAATFADRALDASGAVFLSALSRRPKSLGEITDYLMSAFSGAVRETVEQDAVELFTALEQGGFIVSGETPEELTQKDVRFSYAAITDGAAVTYGGDSNTVNPGDAKALLDRHFLEQPHLRQFQIELTSRCNERCVHCYIPHENKQYDIERALYYDMLEQCRQMGVLGLTLSGGEPLLHPDFCDFLRRAKEGDFSVNVLSNLTLLDDAVIAAMEESCLSSVQVSLYSMEASIHDAITGVPGSFYKTRAAIEKLRAHNIPLQIACPVMKQNRDSVRSVITWAQQNNIRPLCDYIMMARYDHSTGNLANRLDFAETEAVIKTIMDYDEDYQQEIRRIDINHIDTEDISEMIVCGVGISSACMVANGNIYPCAGWQDYVCGNVRQTPLREIWEHSPRMNYLRRLRKKDFPQCLICPDRGFCSMCMVRNANENPDGNPLKINEHFCTVASLNRKVALNWKSAQPGR